MEKILDTYYKRQGRGFCIEYLVKWVGYLCYTWEPINALEECIALEEFLVMRGG